MAAVIPNEDWTAEVVGQMHKYRIRNTDLAEKCGYNPTYISTLLNGRKNLHDETIKAVKEKIIGGLNALIAERTSGASDENEETDQN